jgi:hypothetical protein
MSQFVDEPGLFENAQSLLLGHSQHVNDARRLVLSQRHIRDLVNAELLRAPITLKAVEQHVTELLRRRLGLCPECSLGRRVIAADDRVTAGIFVVTVLIIFDEIDPFQRLFDAPFGDRGPQARFASVIPHPIVLKTQVQGRQFDERGHRAFLRRVFVQKTQSVSFPIPPSKAA